MDNDMDSILISVKKMIGPTEDYSYFDPDLIMHINSVFMILNQLGVGPAEGFSITGDYDLWSDFLPSGQQLEAVKTYIFLKVKMIFDPPQSSSVMEAMKNQIAEFEWRLNVAVDPGESTI